MDALRHFTNAPKKSPCVVITSDRKLARVCEVLLRCYYTVVLGGVEEGISVFWNMALRNGVNGSWRSEQQRRN
jgi:hypothetical protein